MGTDAQWLQLSKVWKWDGDWMQCRHCKRALVASRDGEKIIHKLGCRNVEHDHPWQELRALITAEKA
jgi:hypothetical protein